MSYPIAILDYGIGGIGLTQLIKHSYPSLPLLYFSDSGAVPYGKMPKTTLRNRILQILNYLSGLGVQRIVVACHAASTVILPNDHGVTGIQKLTIDAVLASGKQHIGVIGGGRTIRSGYYRKQLIHHGLTVQQRVAQPMSILVERGDTSSVEAQQTVSQIVGPLKGIDALLMACTHYPAMKGVLQNVLGRQVMLIDPITHVFNSLQAQLRHNEATGNSLYLTTGDPKLMQKAALHAFGWDTGEPRKILF